MNRRSFLRFLGVAPVAVAAGMALPNTTAARGMTAAEAIKRLRIGRHYTLLRESELIPLRTITFDNLKMKERTDIVSTAIYRLEARFAELQKQIPRSYEDDRAITKHDGEEAYGRKPKTKNAAMVSKCFT